MGFDEVMEDKDKLPPGYETVKRNGKSVRLGEQELPWLNGKEEIKVPLVEVKLAGGKRFLLGSAVSSHNTLVEEASQVANKPGGQEKANAVFYHAARLVIEGDPKNVARLQHPVSDKPTYYGKALTGERTYFIKVDDIDGIPVIIKVASCDKNGQARVLRVISEA